MQAWKRRCNELAFSWGTIGMTSLDEPRPNYRGQMGYDAVTGRLQPQFPRWKTNVIVNFEDRRFLRYVILQQILFGFRCTVPRYRSYFSVC